MNNFLKFEFPINKYTRTPPSLNFTNFEISLNLRGILEFGIEIEI